MDVPSVAVVVVNYRTPELALRCLTALARERQALPNLRVIVVDGGSGDGSADKLRSGLTDPALAGWTELLALPINGGFGYANNQAILRLLRASPAPEFIHLLNPDAVIEPAAVQALLQEMRSKPRVAACGSQLLDEHGMVLGAAFRFPSPLREFARGLRTTGISRRLGIQEQMIETLQALDCDWVTGASVMLRSAALRETGLFDDGFFLYFEEVELMWRLRRAGWTIRHNPASRVTHVGGAATGVGKDTEQHFRRLPEYWHQSRARFFVLCYGPARAWGANLLWLAGHALWLLRATLQSRRDVVPHEGRDHIRLALLRRLRNRQHSFVAWNQTPGIDAAWMRTGR
jgi:N-acetylglucosaminyl-diphospho-decaprenol L-rhamnosyltransferase